MLLQVTKQLVPKRRACAIYFSSAITETSLNCSLDSFEPGEVMLLSLFQSEDVIKSENDEADDMPEVQDTVQFIPGSKLLWRINCRPPNSSQVTVSISVYLPVTSDSSQRTWVMFKGSPVGSVCLSVLLDRFWQFLLQQQNKTAASCLLHSCAESSTPASELVECVILLQLLHCVVFEIFALGVAEIWMCVPQC